MRRNGHIKSRSAPEAEEIRPGPRQSHLVDVKAIAYDEIRVPIQEATSETQERVKTHLTQQLESLHLNQAGDKLVYGNTSGLELIAEVAELKNSYEQIRKEISILKAQTTAEIKELRLAIRSADTRIQNLTLGFQTYMSTRKGFIENFKRDIKKTTCNQTAISQRNLLAHEADCLGDATLYQNEQRTDGSVYRKLYGMKFTEVLAWHSAKGDSALFNILNAYGTLVSQGRIVTEEVKDAFKHFISCIEEHWVSPIVEDNSPTFKACYSFWNTYNKMNK